MERRTEYRDGVLYLIAEDGMAYPMAEVMKYNNPSMDFDPATGPLALNWAGAACPPAVGNASCESFAVLTSDCAWRSVEDAGSGAALTASLASPNALALTLQGGAAGLTIVAVRGFFANWPLVALRNAAGLPADPFLLNVTAHDCPWPHAAAWVDTGLHA